MEFIVEDKAISDYYYHLIDSYEQSLFFHHPEYLNLLSNHLKAHVLIFAYKLNNRYLIAMPFLLKKTSIGNVLNSLAYFGSNGSFIYNNNSDNIQNFELANNLTAQINNWANNNDIISINIVSNYFHTSDFEKFKTIIKPDHVIERIGQVTELPDYSEHFEEDLMAVFEDPRPRNIRKALKSGVVVELSDGNNEDWEFLHQIHAQNMGAIGAPVKHLSFFTDIPKFVSKKHYSLYIAKLEGKKIGAMLVFQFNKTIEYYTPGTDVEFRNLQPSSLLIFQAMKDLAAKGYKYWNWGGTASREAGVYDFKKKWGAQERLYWHLTKIKNNKLLEYSSQQLIENFYGFFVIPFNQLKN